LPGSGSISQAVWAVFLKECRSEWRTRYGVGAALLFALTSLVAVSFAVGRMPDRPDLLAALFWIVMLFDIPPNQVDIRIGTELPAGTEQESVDVVIRVRSAAS
jgi:hypothetical protein